MKIKHILMLGVLSALLFSCAKEENQVEDYTIRFNVNYPATRVTSTGFESGDTCGVYMTEYENDAAQHLQVSGNVINNASLVNSGGSWTLKPKAYWDSGVKYDVYAYYPYGKPESTDNYRFSVATDQNTDGGYSVSDFLWASATGVQYPDVVSLTFKHILSKVVINLVKGDDYTGEIPSDAAVVIHNLYSDAEIDLESGSATYYGKGSKKSITAKKEGVSTFSAIIPPQRMETRVPFVEVLAGGVSYLAESRMTFKEGMQHTFNIVLSDNPEKISIDIGGEIVDW